MGSVKQFVTKVLHECGCQLINNIFLYSTVTSGQGANNYQPAPAYGY